MSYQKKHVFESTPRGNLKKAAHIANKSLSNISIFPAKVLSLLKDLEILEKNYKREIREKETIMDELGEATEVIHSARDLIRKVRNRKPPKGRHSVKLLRARTLLVDEFERILGEDS